MLSRMFNHNMISWCILERQNFKGMLLTNTLILSEQISSTQIFINVLSAIKDESFYYAVKKLLIEVLSLQVWWDFSLPIVQLSI